MAFAILAGAFGSAFQHGFNTGVLNAPQKLITEWIGGCNTTLMKKMDEEGAENDADLAECTRGYNEVVIIWSWIVSTFCVGGIIGGSAIGVVSSRLGRLEIRIIFKIYPAVQVFRYLSIFNKLEISSNVHL